MVQESEGWSGFMEDLPYRDGASSSSHLLLVSYVYSHQKVYEMSNKKIENDGCQAPWGFPYNIFC